ncbi:fructosamine kinase family protein [Paenibacillus sp. TRM 82003]|uniref:fructosamine kinase family protein n=1 Tax=Kineococcus sp. TRM81007 TaxID=2925831 RepID=UPI001F584D2D|nr:fructosamine kinase family protein [Kineococcus sp. TRM81007]MCI2236973.1 fructosamine kinase family protein [Kineococcus sp. TRM81007]MCI3926632.1 fructosamine kinase family protein [Paenibacillus sp. TRM 82003]
MGSGREFLKRAGSAPPGALAAEAAGLAWLAEAGGAAVCPVREVRPDALVLDRVEEVPASAAAAEALGRDLATTHAAGADRFGAPPPGVTGDAWIASLPLPMSPSPEPWGTFYAARRLEPYLRTARENGAVDAGGAALVERVCARLADGDEALVAGAGRPARLHGDLWSGNVLWSPGGAVLIDCAAHGGHPETDLAMLALFGLPHLDRVLASYTEAAGTADGWRERVPLHQLHPLLVHAALFGGGYGAQAVRAAERALAL